MGRDLSSAEAVGHGSRRRIHSGPWCAVKRLVSSVKQLVPERPASRVVFVTPLVLGVIAALVLFIEGVVAVDDLVQFAAVEPNTPAVGTNVRLHVLPH
jgi:hypothetical protein